MQEHWHWKNLQQRRDYLFFSEEICYNPLKVQQVVAGDIFVTRGKSGLHAKQGSI